MIEYEVQKWLNEKLRSINLDAKHFYRLSATDMLYLYVQVLTEYKVKISVEDINHGCFSSLEKMTDTIVRSLSHSKEKEDDI